MALLCLRVLACRLIDTLVGNVEAFIELEGMSEDQAIDATLDCFPGTPDGRDTLRKLLTYQELPKVLYKNAVPG